MVRAVGVMDSTQDSGSCNPGSTPGSRIRKPCYNSIYKQNAANLLQIITKKDESQPTRPFFYPYLSIKSCQAQSWL